MKFTKMCGAGNDFVILDNFSGEFDDCDLSALAKSLCRRKFSVGADGLMVLSPPKNGGDCAMRFYNNDGSAAEMCGNGARCVCRYCFDAGIAGKTQRIETTAGLVTGERLAEDFYRIRLNTPSELREYADCAYVVLGEPGIPHAVLEADLTAPRSELRELARNLRHSPRFPGGANVNLCSVVSRSELRLLTFERGVEDFTLACGTGAGASVAALSLQGKLSGENVKVHVDGGTLFVDAAAQNGKICDLYLSGNAIACYTGTI
ncbi:MAG: diaminopimelate epimerase [Oscillospiraceae bacterium]|jgi:diaminopimelate epimerase|nr:diaminopimelate epimerase [Oscillospiraceae bacterium]